MIVLSSFLEHIGRLVHADARSSELEGARHRAFIATRLGLFVAALALAPIALALGHVPALWEAAAAVWLSMPLAAAVVASRTGRLRTAQALSVAAWIGFGLTTTLLGGTSLGGGCVLLLLAPIEAALATQSALMRWSAGAALGFALMLGVADLAGGSIRLGAGTDAAILAPALLYILALAASAAALDALQQRQHAAGEQRYRVLAAAIGDLVIRYDRTGGVLLAGREAEPIFGIDPRELLGRGFFERVHVADRPAFMKLFADAADSGENVSARLRLKISGVGPGSRPVEPVFAWIEVRARRFETSDDLRRRAAEATIVAIVRDITAQAHHEIAMAEAKEQAERANAWKDSFLANVSHELRTPLNAIIGFSEMLSNEELSPRDPAKQREYARIITSSGHHLLSVVNSLLDISKIEAGRFELNPEHFALLPMIQSCCDMIGLKADQGGIGIRQQLEPPLEEMIGDKRACKQIVINLLSNAIKFTPRGGHVTISARPQGTSVLITVADTGVGIAPRDLVRLGDAFFQGRSGIDRPFEGTGLGLSVVRGLVGLHGGGISVESTLGEGTRVTVRLPLDCRNAAAGTSARIEIIPRSARTVAALPIPLPKVQKIA